MHDSGTKHPENRIHLFDPVGLINDTYGGYRQTSYAARHRRPTKSYGNFEEVSNSTNSGLISYDHSYTTEHPKAVGGLRSYDSYTEADTVSIISYDSFSMETKGGVAKSYDHSNNEDANGGGIRFEIVNNLIEDDDDDDASTPRLWKSSSPNPSPKKSLNSSPLHKTSTHMSTNDSSPKSINSSPLHPSSLKPLSHPPLHPNTMQNTSSKSANSSPLHPSSPKSLNPSLGPNHHHYPQALSPSSRTQAIAKGRRELMDMVRDLPESFYELSLKDIVEQKAGIAEVKKEIDIPEDQKPIKETANSTLKETKKPKSSSSKKVKKSESKKKMVRSRSVDNGRFLLRTSVFPIFTGSKKNKRNMGPSNSFKIAPMPKPQSTSNGTMKVGEKDWWRRKACISSEGEESNGLSSKSGSTGSSSSSSSSQSITPRRNTRFLPICCLFNGRRIRSKK